MTGSQQIKQALGVASLTMRYEDGGKVQVFTINGEERRVPGHLHTADIIAFLKGELNNEQ